MLTINQIKNIIYIILIIFIILIFIIIYILSNNCEVFNNKILYNEYFNNKSLKNKYYSMKSGKKEKSLISKINSYNNSY